MNPVIIVLVLLIIFLAIFGEKLIIKFNEVIWSKEKPDKIIGVKVRLRDFDGLGKNPPDELTGVIADFSHGGYRIQFEKPFIFDGNEENYAIVSARHVGFPVSRISKRRILAVGGKLESGRGFISLIAKK